jgi:ABC-type nitrate/sulfonate/bicarbonate transport system substrate-binding protein
MTLIANPSLVRRMEEATKDAYSYDRYGSAKWRKVIRHLLKSYNEKQVELILGSKYMRWAADHVEDNNGVSAAKVIKQLNKWKDGLMAMIEEEGLDK